MRNIKSLTKLLAVCLSVVVFMNVSAASYADSAKAIQPRFTYIDHAVVFLHIADGVAYVSGSTTGKADVTETHVKCNLEKLMGSYWMQLKSWSDTQPGRNASVNGDLSVTKGTYRVMGTHRCNSETITTYSSNQTCE